MIISAQQYFCHETVLMLVPNAKGIDESEPGYKGRQIQP